jgi:hypothetical protein
MITHEEKLADTIATLEWRVMNGQLVERRLTKRGVTMAKRKRSDRGVDGA